MITIRPSDIGSWTLCPKRVEYRESQGIFPSYAMTRGTLLHRRIEHALGSGETPTSFDALNEYAAIVLEDTGEALESFDLPPKAVGTLIGEVDAAYATWRNDVLPQIAAFGDDIVVEQRLERHLPLSNHAVGGTPDLVIPKDKWIIDWKTAGRQWKTDKAVGELQPPAYAWLNGWDTARFTFYVCDMSTFVWQQHTVWVTPAQVNAWIDLATNVADAISEGIFPATPSGQSWKGTRGWHCSSKYCSAWAMCDAKHLIADGEGTQVRDPRQEWT